MPIYTYRCENCGVRFDRFQKFQDQPLTWCPECNKKTLHKVYQPVGIVFKGSGFYATDHRSPSGQSRANGEKTGETKADDKTETKTETKPDSQPASSTTAPAKGDSKSE